MRPTFDSVSVGDNLPEQAYPVRRVDLVRYAGASGDFNPIHWNERFAREVGLPGVIAHGMWTMGAAVGVVTEWARDPGAVVDYQTRFARPVVVPDPGAAQVEVTATVGAIDPETSTARIDLAVVVEGQRVLAKAQALVRLAA